MREFVTLEQFVERPTPAAPAQPVETPEPGPVAETGELDIAVGDALSAVRRFRAALADAFVAEIQTLLRDIAASVLARELELAPADVAAIVENVRARCADEAPLRIRVHPGDAASVCLDGVPVVVDGRLRRGDVEIDLRSGTIDATLGARLQNVLVR